MEISLLYFMVGYLLHSTGSVLLTMKGGELIAYDISREHIATEKLQIVFKFKTIDPSGLLLFSENTHLGDYISLELNGGRLRYKARLGFDDNSEQVIIVGRGLNDYEWHVVDLNLNGRNVSIQLDDETTRKSFGGEFARLDLDYKVFIGGIPDDVDVSPYKITNRKYSGCFTTFFFDDIDVLYKAKFSKRSFTSTGDLLWNQCEDLNYEPIMTKNPQDYALTPTYLKNSLSISFKFRTHIGEGLLFAKISRKVTVFLELRKGILAFNVEIRGQGPIVMRKGVDLNDGFWHRVEFLVSKEIIKFKLDQHAATTHNNPWSHIIEFHAGNATLGGGEEQIGQGFVGCMYDIWVDDTPVNYHKLGPNYFVGVIKKCELQDKCLYSPCKHGGKCSQDHLSYKCDCLSTMYSGANCQESIYQPSCQDYKNLGLNEDSYCLIDPDGDGRVKPFRVLCNMTGDDKKAVTIIQHNLRSDNIAVSSGVVEDGSFHHSLEYGIPIETFNILLQRANKCRQHVSFKCKNSFLMRSPRGPPDTVWIGRRGNLENYWGGAEPDSGTCACRSTKTCSHPYRYCNCDIGDDLWREDSGSFSQIDRLPVFMLSFKLSSNQSFFSVGNLQCEFNADTEQRNLSKGRVLKACTSINAQTTIRTRQTNPNLDQKERIINYRNNKKTSGAKSNNAKPTVNICKKDCDKAVQPNVNVNVTVELSKTENGLKFTLSVYAVIVIAVATVIVVIIIAIVILAKRCQRRRNSTPDDYDSEDEYDSRRNETTEMCTFFGSVARSERNRPVIEVHRHSIHCETLDELPPAYREFGDYIQPITTHIDLSYKSRKRGFFC